MGRRAICWSPFTLFAGDSSQQVISSKTVSIRHNNVFILRVLTPEEWNTLPPGVLDQGVTDSKRSVCQPGVLHCM